MKKAVKEGQSYIKKEIKNSKNLDFYNDAAHFIGDYTLEVKNEKIKGDKVFIVSGARPLIPLPKAWIRLSYLTNEMY
jgi:pyruvate/2-oxoglutarate dehydrogenase complex dihydrolipoamide dehydrogenase (E3) component